MFDTQNNAFRKLFEEGKKYINLQIDYAKLTATEKISVILGMSVLFAVILVLSVGDRNSGSVPVLKHTQDRKSVV